MSLHFKLINYDELYHRLQTNKVLLNTRDIFNSEEKAVLDSLIIKTYSDDNLSVIPSCQCGELKGTYYVGDVCQKCNTTVVSSLDDNISFLLWLEQPKEVEMFISPIILSMLLQRYKITRPSVQLVKYIMIPNFPIDRKQQKKNLPILEKLDFILKSNNIKKGYNSFVQNFFRIVEILESEFVKNTEKDKQQFVEFLLNNKDKIFSRYLPFPNKIMFSMDSNELGKYIDKSILNPVNVIRRVTGIDLYTKPSAVKQLKVAKSLTDLADFYTSYIKTTFFSKTGLIRQHVSSTRCHFTARGVIVSISDPHTYDELYLPWSMACTLFKVHILNRLYARNYSYKQAINFIMYHNKIYHPLLDEVFKEIIASSPNGIKAFFNRNPSLHRGSIQTVRITKIKSDPGDNCISMSYLIGKSFNSDYDGDSLNLTLALTEKVQRNMGNFEPHHNVLGLTGVNEFSSILDFPKTIVSTLSNWYSS